MANGDINKPEVRPDVAKWKIYNVNFNVKDRRCKVVYELVDAGGTSLDDYRTVMLANDDGVTEFNDLIVSINANNDIKESITSAVKTKLGI